MLYTDHQALLKVLKSEDVTGRISRWQPCLSEYDLDLEKKGLEASYVDDEMLICGSISCYVSGGLGVLHFLLPTENERRLLASVEMEDHEDERF
ncbi:hypothetical protein HO173_009283 [Letharia columbiana]|uniref:Reverse transcriptase RNase H-like domain-containing protein n=1 Tax=Letharia columbiana TaxID=112416 RepID=A0A8H6FQ43_9LECA|nr:uncharacterized protein HO173_009283 [Letharia columbiana]KAF6232615.1 hypothetical protein HO173_009283 [Letharia columbiana]